MTFSDEVRCTVGHCFTEKLGWWLIIMETTPDASLRNSVLLWRMRCTCLMTYSLAVQPTSKLVTRPFTTIVSTKDAYQISSFSSDFVNKILEGNSCL